MNKYDVAVAGAGAFGSWTAFHLQKYGLKTALIDPYGAANNRASSGGESRIIRMGYGADEIYTRWSDRSLGLWRELFEDAGRSELFQRTGVLWMAREDDPYTLATLSTLKRAGIAFEEMRSEDLRKRWPQIEFGEITWAIYEPGSGALLARRAVQTVVEHFIKAGGDYFKGSLHEPAAPGIYEFTLGNGERISAEKIVFACGPWLPRIFPDLLGSRIHVTRQEVFFFGAPEGDARFAPPLMPTWIDFGAETYGIPDLENRGFKIALDRHGEPFDPDFGERACSDHLLSEVRAFMWGRFPAMKNAPLLESRVCQYENTSNGDFLIDRHPALENVWLVGGGSGHGFKHGPAVGEYVSRLLLSETEMLARFSIGAKESHNARSVF